MTTKTTCPRERVNSTLSRYAGLMESARLEVAAKFSRLRPMGLSPRPVAAGRSNSDPPERAMQATDGFGLRDDVGNDAAVRCREDRRFAGSTRRNVGSVL